MTTTFRAAVLKCCRVGCSTTTCGDLLDKNHSLSEIWTKYLLEDWNTWEHKIMSELCILYMLSSGTWETTCFKVRSWMYLSCTCKDFLLIYMQAFCAKGDKCLRNNWGGGGEGKKKVGRKCTRRGAFLGPLSFYIT